MSRMLASCSRVKLCDICGKSDNDSVELGEFMEKAGINVHYYCLQNVLNILPSNNMPMIKKYGSVYGEELLSTNLVQAGTDMGGILGFLIKDIKRFIKSIERQICCYCTGPSASVHCTDCTKKFHLVCGLKNNCQFQFADTFSSYCHEHHKIKHPKKHGPEEGCYICLSAIGEYNALTSVMAKCCSCGWAHRRCLKKFALSAGYYLKCIWCRNEQFRDEVRLVGIFVPDRDAEWEKDKGAYLDFYRGHSTCNAHTCLCPQGRSYGDRKGKWTILSCNACRAYGEHIECSKEKKEIPNFLCLLCKKVLHKTGGATNASIANNSQLDITLFITKSQKAFNQNTIDDDSRMFTEDDELQSSGSIFTEEEINAYEKYKGSHKGNKEFFVVVDERTKSIVGSLEAKRKDALNKSNLSMADVQFERTDFFPILNPSIERGCKILDEIIQKVVQETVIAPKLHIELSDNENE